MTHVRLTDGTDLVTEVAAHTLIAQVIDARRGNVVWAFDIAGRQVTVDQVDTVLPDFLADRETTTA